MDSIGKHIPAVVAKAMEAAASEPSPSVALPVPRSTAIKPPLLDHDCDIDLPRKLFSAWIPDNGPREIRRALTAEERSRLELRAAAVRDGLQPYFAEEEHAVDAEIAAMLNGFRLMARQQDDDVTATVEIIRCVLQPFPLWAIAKACMTISQAQAGLDPRYPPNDSQIYVVVERVVTSYRKTLDTVEALFAAPVERRDPPPCTGQRRSCTRPTRSRCSTRQAHPASSGRRQARRAGRRRPCGPARAAGRRGRGGVTFKPAARPANSVKRQNRVPGEDDVTAGLLQNEARIVQ
jgi:hypothetical protein